MGLWQLQAAHSAATAVTTSTVWTKGPAATTSKEEILDRAAENDVR
jgi:hypothetical protein